MMSQCHSWSSLCRTTLRFGEVRLWVEFDYSFKSIYYYDESMGLGLGLGGRRSVWDKWLLASGMRLPPWPVIMVKELGEGGLVPEP